MMDLWVASRYILKGYYSPMLQISQPKAHEFASLSCHEKRLLLGLHLLRGFPLPQEMASNVLVDRCHKADVWAEVPLVVVNPNNTPSIVPVLLGRVPVQGVDIIEPERWLGSKAYEATCKALRLVGGCRCGFLLLPLYCSLIDGGSLALPLAAYARRLRDNKPLPQGAAMTGAIDEKGNVLSVGNVAEKYDCAIKKNNFQFFFYPAEKGLAYVPSEKSLPVSNLEEADTLLDLLGDDPAAIAQRLPQWKASPAEFFSWLESSGKSYNAQIHLLNLARRQLWYTDCSSYELSAALKELKARWDKLDKQGELCQILVDFFPFEKVKDLPPTLSLLALLSARITLENHKGADIRKWEGLAENCLNEIEQKKTFEFTLEDLTIPIRFWGGIWHNTFRFLPEDISPEWLNSVNFAAKFASDPKLGKIYGFLAQHYAFCGMYKEAFDYINCSMQHFSNEKDRDRRRIDRIYLFLESTCPEKAHQELSTLLHANCGDMLSTLVVQKNDAYVHAAFARLCLSMPHLLRGYPVESILKGDMRQKHPWQLWAYNCGLLLAKTNPHLARKCFYASLHICQESEHTLIAMALLPLASLYAIRLESMEEILSSTVDVLNRMREHCKKGLLYEPHFNPLLTMLAEAALKEVNINAAHYFPFNYR